MAKTPFGDDKAAYIEQRIAFGIAAHERRFVHKPMEATKTEPVVPKPDPVVPKPPAKPDMPARTIIEGPVPGPREGLSLRDKTIVTPASSLVDGGTWWGGGVGIHWEPGDNKFLKAHNCGIRSQQYGLGFFDLDSVELDYVNVFTHSSGRGDENNYCGRGQCRRWRSNYCTFINGTADHVITKDCKAVLRPQNCKDFVSTGDQFDGWRILLGGGLVNEWDNPLPFIATFQPGEDGEGGRMWMRDRILIPAASIVTFKSGFKFTGTPLIEVHGRLIISPDCIDTPQIQKNTSRGGPAIVEIR